MVYRDEQITRTPSRRIKCLLLGRLLKSILAMSLI